MRATMAVPMPLSEDEQRILHEIEAHLSESDPGLAQAVGETTVYRHGARMIKWGVLAFLAGLAILVVSFASSLFVGFMGFLVMLWAAFLIERNVRRVGKAGLQSLASSMKVTSLRDALRRRGGDADGP